MPTRGVAPDPSVTSSGRRSEGRGGAGLLDPAPTTAQNEIGEPAVAALPDPVGGPSRTRTLDPLIKSQLLYQLS